MLRDHYYRPVWADAAKKDRLLRQLPSAKAAARSVLIVHVTSVVSELVGKAGRGMKSLLCTRSNTKTRAAEIKFGISPRVYFFAGRACLFPGTAALAFGSEVERSATGDASPFDSGGLAIGHIKSNQEADPKRVFDETFMSLELWRVFFARYLAGFFETPSKYWMAAPQGPDPHGLHALNQKNPLAWTFEIRIQGPVSLALVKKWSANQHATNRLNEALGKLVGGRAFNPEAHEFKQKALDPRGSADYAFKMERWIKSRLFR